MTMKPFRIAYLALIGIVLAQPALAYIGPGAGITMLSALWGVVVAVALAVGAVLFWPIRALLRRTRRKPDPAVGTSSTLQTPTMRTGDAAKDVRP